VIAGALSGTTFILLVVSTWQPRIFLAMSRDGFCRNILPNHPRGREGAPTGHNLDWSVVGAVAMVQHRHSRGPNQPRHALRVYFGLCGLASTLLRRVTPGTRARFACRRFLFPTPSAF